MVRSNPKLFGTASSISTQNTIWSGLPVVFDEVFTGLYRLGRRTSASFLGVDPDISVHAKLLTGGLIPLAVTLASQEIYDSFLSEEKSDALLHGHSYTAHPVGCLVSEKSVSTMLDMERKGAWSHFQELWHLAPETRPFGQQVWSQWSPDLIQDLSNAHAVESVFAIGSVFSVSLQDRTGQKGTRNLITHREFKANKLLIQGTHH